MAANSPTQVKRVPLGTTLSKVTGGAFVLPYLAIYEDTELGSLTPPTKTRPPRSVLRTRRRASPPPSKPCQNCFLFSVPAPLAAAPIPPASKGELGPFVDHLLDGLAECGSVCDAVPRVLLGQAALGLQRCWRVGFPVCCSPLVVCCFPPCGVSPRGVRGLCPPAVFRPARSFAFMGPPVEPFGRRHARLGLAAVWPTRARRSCTH